MAVEMNILERHRTSAGRVRQGKQETTALRQAPKRVECRLEQVDGEWLLFLGGSKRGLLATDAEVSLWLKLKEMETKDEHEHGTGISEHDGKTRKQKPGGNIHAGRADCNRGHEREHERARQPRRKKQV